MSNRRKRFGRNFISAGGFHFSDPITVTLSLAHPGTENGIGESNSKCVIDCCVQLALLALGKGVTQKIKRQNYTNIRSDSSSRSQKSKPLASD